MKIESTKEDKETDLYFIRMSKKEIRLLYDFARKALVKYPKHTLEFKVAKVMLENICYTIDKVVSQSKK